MNKNRIVTRSLLLGTLLLSVVSTAAEPGVVKFREHLFKPRDGTQTTQKWNWPTLSDFRTRHSRYNKDAWAVQVVESSVVLHLPGGTTPLSAPEVFILARSTSEGLDLSSFGGSSPVDRALVEGKPWVVQSGEFGKSRRVELVGNDGVRAVVTPVYANPRALIAPDLWDLWVYTNGLLESDPPVFDEGKDGRYPGYEDSEHVLCLELARVRKQQGPVAASFQIRKALAERSISMHDSHWYEEVQKTREAGDTELALEIYRYFRPIGACSMDQGPQEAARQYADLSYDRGKLGSYLQLRLAIIGNQFERMAYSSYGDRASQTKAEELEATGLDVDRFLLGLSVAVETVPRHGVSPWRLGRAIAEAGRADKLQPVLQRTAEDTQLDPWNGTLAALILASVLYHESLGQPGISTFDGQPQKFQEAAARVRTLSIPRAARVWLGQQ